jgi:hypothetical protein
MRTEGSPGRRGSGGARREIASAIRWQFKMPLDSNGGVT